MTMFKGTKTCFLICMLVLTSVTLTITGVVFSRIHREDDLETEILKSLYCQCGCGKIVYDCFSPGHDCYMAPQWKNRIARELAAGKTKDQIINGFVEDYGEQVLVKEMELSIWIIPVIITASLVGAVIIYQYVRRRHRDVVTRELSGDLRKRL